MDNKKNSKQMNELIEPFKCGWVAIIGAPNVGKSTLLNILIGQKVSIVTNKPQTTRHNILGILSNEKFQIVFLDTPGLIKPKYLLHSAMMNAAHLAISDADIVILMIDALNSMMDKSIEHEIALQSIEKVKKPIYLVINKIDAINRLHLLPIIDFYSKMYSFEEIFPISALNAIGTTDLLKSLVEKLPYHQPYYPLDYVSDASQRFFVSELIREKIFERFRQEIPYSTTVDIIEFREKKDGKDLIRAEVYVERQSQKAILIGKKGQALKQVGELARIEIEKFLERPVFLELYVKVMEKWRNNDTWLKRLGYKI